ncbi:sensory box/GGDEF family protein [Candidatus Moduliflexus flocculans]|uniref:Sensory box/GGDEF family protein n=1 Tax=Candidatus Moduliflexus flocculans TaxID=1499966 RepID=A0A0S6VSL0_9BACT|nr:sensory box/GGDEF family protein [Candidatus Moduliflexus flocculans]
MIHSIHAKLLTIYFISVLIIAAISRLMPGDAAIVFIMIIAAIGSGLFWRILATDRAKIVSSEQNAQEPKPSNDEERHLLHAMVDALPDLIYIKDTEHRFVIANRALVRHMGFHTCDEIIGKSDIDLLAPEFATRYYEDERVVLETGKPLLERVEPGIDKQTGEKRWFLSTKVPFYDQQGTIRGIIGIGRDISKSIKEKEALQSLVSSLTWESLLDASDADESDS